MLRSECQAGGQRSIMKIDVSLVITVWTKQLRQSFECFDNDFNVLFLENILEVFFLHVFKG